MSKLIINIDTDIDNKLALEYVAAVIVSGRISYSRMGDQYCYVTTFKDDTVVYAGKPSSTTDTFRISKRTPNPTSHPAKEKTE